MKSKAIKTIVITILSIITLIIIDKILVSNYIYGFFSSMLLGLLLGGICSICIVLILILILIIWESVKEVKEGKSAEESILNSKKIKKIACFVIIITIFISCGASFLSQGDFIRKYRGDKDCSALGCFKQAEFCSNQLESLGYCNEHKSNLLSNIKWLNTERSGTSGTKHNNEEYWDNYDYDDDGNINQGEWEDALGDYMDDVMGN